jgi:hypothetical protein
MTSEPKSFEQFLTEFREIILSATARLQAISQEQSTSETAADEWRPIEILGHLVDSAANNHQRFVRAQFSDDLVFPDYEQDGWVRVQKYCDTSWHDLVQLWSSYNLHLQHVASVIPHDILTKARVKHNLDQIAFNLDDQSQATTLEDFIRDYVDHLRHHLNQILGEGTYSTE